ncbi:hypothetical protein GCM10011316_17970 [Roseibium aquae]|uniref:Cytochrome c domain-containing protein n=1 Tax=Roseibium aquae TaxID=1323746 RepID=A0A916TJ06_9HYPH|nr:hypothetical protein GCM10011316_17970 [Roseibium aquae]
MFVLFAASVALVLWVMSFPVLDGSGHGPGPQAAVQVKIPELDHAERAGALVFNDHCALCHGQDGAGGTGQGPPLVHQIYKPSHHADGAFWLAVRNGVRAHHWTYGDMAPVPGLADAEIVQIITYVRALQRANGIQ